MSSLRLRAARRRRGNRLAALLVALTVAGSLAVHHGMPPGMDHMPAAGVCLAILAVGAALAIAPLSGTMRRRGRD